MRTTGALLGAAVLGAVAMVQVEVIPESNHLRVRSLMVDSRETPPNGDENWRRWPGVLQLRFPYLSGSSYITRLCTGTVVNDTSDAQGILWIAVTAPGCIPPEILTSTTDFLGASAPLPTAPAAAVCSAHAGDAAATRLGPIERASWVNQPVVGGNMAAVNIRPNMALPEAQLVVPYPIQTFEVQTFDQGRYMGYGPDRLVSFTQGNPTYSGAGVLRNSSAYITGVTPSQVRQTDDCQFSSSVGGEMVVETVNVTEGGVTREFNSGVLCSLVGDGGAPLFMRYPQTVLGTWYLSGIFRSSDNLNCLPYGHPSLNNARVVRHTFTSTSARRDWLRNLTEILASRPPIRPECPSPSPTPSPTPSSLPTPTPSGTPSVSANASAVAVPAFFAREVNVIWVSVVAVAFTLLVISSLFYVWYRQAQIRAYQRQGLKLKAVLEAPAVGQKDAVKVTEFEARQAEERSLAREGELLAPVRRLSMAVSPEQLAEAEAARAARAIRRRRSSAGEALSPRTAAAEGAQGGGGGAWAGEGEAPISPSAGGPLSPSAGARKGSITSPKNRRASAGGGPTRRGSAEGPGGRRRNSLAMARGADRKYDHTTVAAGTGTRFSQYEGEHKEMATRGEDMLAPGEVPQDPEEDEDEDEDDEEGMSGPLSPASQARANAASPISPKGGRAHAASPISPKGGRAHAASPISPKGRR